MKLQGFVSALALATAIALPGAAIANNVELSGNTLPGVDGLLPGYGDLNILHQKDWKNRDLETGEYAFFAFHSPIGSGFFDDWSFSLADNANVSISLFDIEIPLGFDFGVEKDGKSSGTPYLFDSKFLTVSLFDGAGHLLGSTGEDGILEVSNLLAGEWYTLTVSGKVNGLLGAGYLGSLQIAEVPLGDSLPLFGSALLVLAIRGRKWFIRQPATA